MHKLQDLIISDELFLTHQNESIVKDKLIEVTGDLVAGLKDLRVNRVNLCCEDAFVFTACFFATMIAGLPVVIFSSEKVAEWGASNKELWLTDSNWQNSLKPSSESKDLLFSPQSTVYFYTSGSTGQPKKVEKAFSNLLDEAKGLQSTFKERVQGCDVFSSVSHLHIYGFLFKLLWPLTTGRRVQLENCIYQEGLLRRTGLSPFIFISSPAFFKRLDSSMPMPANLKCIFSSGGMLLKETSDVAKTCLSSRPIEVLGSTETGGVAFRVQETNNEAWTTFNDVLVNQSEKGCLRVESPYIFDGEFEMADLAKLNSDGTFTLQGRADRIVKIEEKRVSLQEIENAFLVDELVSECAVVALDTRGRQQTAAVVVLSEQGERWFSKISKSAANNYFRSNLSKSFELVTVPRRFRFVKKIPVNSQGKTVLSEVEGMFL